MSERGSLFYVGIVGLSIHLCNLLIAVKHIFACHLDEERACVLLDPRTCFKLRSSSKCTCLQVAEEETEENLFDKRVKKTI